VQQHFPELNGEEAAYVKNPFYSNFAIKSVPDEPQDDFLEMQNVSSVHDLFSEKSLTQF